MRVKVCFTDGATLFGHLVTEWPNLGDVMNSEHTFIRFKRPNGTECLLNKLTIAYIGVAHDDL